MPRQKKIANKANQQLRNKVVPATRCSDGYVRTLEALATSTGSSKATIMHEALTVYAWKMAGKIPAADRDTFIYWIEKI